MVKHSDFIDRLENDSNGRFTVANTDGMASLTVFPPGKNGKPVSVQDVMARLRLFGLEGWEKDRIYEIVKNADSLPWPVCPWREPEPIHGTAEISVSEDEMEAWIEAEPPRFGGAPVGDQYIRDLLHESKVVYGIDEGVILLAVTADKKFSGLIASGDSPMPGSPGYIELFYKVRPEVRPESAAEKDAPRIDLRDLNVIQTCRKGEVLAKMHTPRPGTEGRTVTGRTIPAPVIKTAVLQAGKNTVFEGSELRSTIDGHVKIHPSSNDHKARIDVEEILHLDNVDYSVGHIDYHGSVIINGSVYDGFRVKAEGDIVIAKTAGSVRLQSGGNIVLQGGIVSRGVAYVEAAGNIYAKFSESVTLNARGSIFIEEAVMHSRIMAGERVVVQGGRGEIMGGSVIAGKSIHAKKIGARMGTPTLLNVGLDPERLESLRALDSEKEEKRETLRKIETRLSQMEESRKRGRTIPPEEAEAESKMLLLQTKLNENLESLSAQRDRLYSTVKPDPQSFIEASDAVYPGTEFSFGSGISRYRVTVRPIYNYCFFSIEHDAVTLRHSRLQKQQENN